MFSERGKVLPKLRYGQQHCKQSWLSMTEGTQVLVAKMLLILGTSQLVHKQICSPAPEMNSTDWGVPTANTLQHNTTTGCLLQEQ